MDQNTVSSDRPSIFGYVNPNAYLFDRWSEIKRRNPNLSIRSFARILKLGSHTPLHLMIIGKRTVSKNYVRVFIEYFNLTGEEAAYFEALVKASRNYKPENG